MTKQCGGYPSAAEYQKARRRQSVLIYFQSEHQREDFRARSRAAGFSSFSGWLLQMVINATSGSVFPPEYIEGLRQEADRLRRWLETAREESDEYRRQARTLQDQRDHLIVLLHGLPTGAEVAARFLQESARGPRA